MMVSFGRMRRFSVWKKLFTALFPGSGALFFLFLLKPDVGFSQLPAIRQLNLRQGLPQSEVTSLLEDSRGFIWAGTRGGGLVQLEGNQLIVHNSAKGLANDFISDIQEFPDGRLAVASLYGGLQSFNGKNFSKAIRLPENAELLKISVVGNELVWGISNRGVSSINLEKREFRPVFYFPEGISRTISNAIVGKRWMLISVDSGLYSIDTKSLNRSLLLGKNSHLKGRSISAIQALDDQSAVLISSDGQTAVVDFNQGWPLVSSWKPLPELPLQSGEQIRFVIFGLGQYLKWISTDRNRLISPKQGVLDLSTLNGMKIPPISSLLSDRNGTVWLGTLGSGVLMRPLQSALSYSANPLLANGRLHAVYVTKSGTLLCGGNKTGLIVTGAGKKESFSLFPETDVKAIAENQSHIFVGTETGIRILRKDNFAPEKFYSETGKTIRFHVLPDQSILIGTFGNGAWRMLPGKKPERLIPKETGLEYPYEFLPSGKDELLIASNNGLWKYRMSTGITEKISVPNHITPIFFMATRDVSGNFWFSYNEGIVRLSGKQWTKITVKNGLSSSLIYTLNADSVGNVWVGGSHGLDKIAMDHLGRIKEVINYGPEEGFDGYEANMRGSFANRDFLFVCTIQGLFAMPVKDPMLDPLPVRPEITSFISVNRSQYDSLRPRGNSWFQTGATGLNLEQPELLIFDFKSINPVFPSKIKYSYRMTGAGDNWSKPSSETRASFPGPESGKYAFEVRSTYDGVYFSEPSRLEFTVSVPWYLGKFFFVPALLVVLVLSGLFLASRDKAPETNRFFRRDLKWSDSRGRLFLLILAVSYPLLPILAARFDPAVCFHPLESLFIFLLLSGLFLLSIAGKPGGRKTEMLLKISFFIMVLHSLYELGHNQLNPFLVALLFAVSGLMFVLFSRPLPFILYGLGLNIFAFYCAQTIPNPLFHPVSFQLASAGLSIIMVLVMMASHSAEENLRFAGKVVNEGPVLVLAFDSDENLVYSSGNIEAMTGYQPEALSGKNWEEKIILNDTDLQAFRSLLRHDEKKEMHIALKNPQGENRIFRFQGKSLDQRFRVLLGEDISEKEFLESRFENLVENATDSIFLTDIRGKILYSNPESTFLLGLKREELIGRNYSEFVVEGYRKTIRTFYENQLADKISGSYQEFPVQTRAKQIRWMAFQTSILYQQDGHSVEGLLAIGRDITERIETEQLILIQHKNIADSMAYASRIRSALQPEKEALSTIFTRHAILDEPKDIIGGDFFWMGENGTSNIFVLGDCTGHGVPGAFMTTISMSILRENILKNENQNLELVLENFNRSLKQYLSRSGKEETLDFAEIALISPDFENRELLFISSGISMYRVRNGELTTFQEASRGFGFRLDYTGMSQRIPLEPGDVFYVFSDGVYDQIGGSQGKRLSKSRLMKLILDSDSLNLENGINQIRNGLREWQGKNQQTDDRMLISFRF